MKPYYHWFLAFSFSNRSRSHLWQKSGSFSHPTQLDEIFSQLGEEDGRVWVQIDRDFVGWHDDRHSVAVLLKSPNQVVKKMQIFVEGLESRNQHLSLSFTKLQRPIIILALMGHDFWLFKMRSLEVKLKSFVKHLYLFWLKNVIARWYLKGRWIFFINQTGTWLLRTCLVASCDVMTMSRTQNRFLGWVVSLEADSPHVFAEIFRLIMDQCSHGRTPIKTMGSDKRISKFNIVQDGCFDLNLLQLLTKKRFPIYNKTLQCFKNACFPKNFPVSSLRAHGGASFCWDSFLSLELNDEIEILPAVSYIFFHWILSSRPGWRYHPGMWWAWMGLGDRAQSLSSGWVVWKWWDDMRKEGIVSGDLEDFFITCSNLV